MAIIDDEIIPEIHAHYRSFAKRDAEHDIVHRVIEEIVGKMIDMDMPLQEIASILLPIDHPANSTPGASDA